jgi:4-diphosphocytidyl-2-C-methyl-D-erythritol kinase
MVMMGKPRNLTAEAYAKVNVHLEIGPLREDGYHDIASIFQRISLSDTITVSVREARAFSCHIQGMDEVPRESNTMYRSARLFCQRSAIAAEVSIHCEKRIPAQAGLGGGSTDAATVLHLLNRLFGRPFGPQAIQELALTIGSDVPFFSSGAGAAYVEGRGERLTWLPGRDDLEGLVIMPTAFSNSTARLFAELDKWRLADGRARTSVSKAVLCQAYSQPCAQWPFWNDFRLVMGEHEDWYRELERIVAGFPECYGTVSGSGAAFCVLTPEMDSLQKIIENYQKNCHCFMLFPIKCLHADGTDDTFWLQ